MYYQKIFKVEEYVRPADRFIINLQKKQIFVNILWISPHLILTITNIRNQSRR